MLMPDTLVGCISCICCNWLI